MVQHATDRGHVDAVRSACPPATGEPAARAGTAPGTPLAPARRKVGCLGSGSPLPAHAAHKGVHVALVLLWAGHTGALCGRSRQDSGCGVHSAHSGQTAARLWACGRSPALPFSWQSRLWGSVAEQGQGNHLQAVIPARTGREHLWDVKVWGCPVSVPACDLLSCLMPFLGICCVWQ